jgi:hypothetical protein
MCSSFCFSCTICAHKPRSHADANCLWGHVEYDIAVKALCIYQNKARPIFAFFLLHYNVLHQFRVALCRYIRMDNIVLHGKPHFPPYACVGF